MAVRKRQDEEEGGPWLSIGALGKATGIAVETLRTWENRYGFPVPRRKPSGHCVYPLSAVPRLRRIAQALSLGHRAGQVVGAADEALDQLLDSTGAASSSTTPRAGLPPAEDLEGLLKLVRAFDADRLTRTLLGDWGRMTPVEFLEQRVGPLARAVGAGWENGDLEVRHEHFLAERVGDLLRSLRLPFEERADGPLVVFATLPGAALLLASLGCRCAFLGPEVPLRDVIGAATELSPRAVAVSVSVYTKGGSTPGTLRKLRERLPQRVALLVGGEGAPRGQKGITAFDSLRQLADWGRDVVAGRSPGEPQRKAPARRA